MRELIKGDDAVRFIEELLDSIDAYYDAISRTPRKIKTGVARIGGRTRKKQRITRLQRRHRRQRR